MTIETKMALSYANHDGVELQGDLYLPKAGPLCPALVAVHGGGFRAGARNAYRFWGPYLAERGYALFSVSYRLAKKGHKTFPQAVQDVLAAIRYLRANAAQHGIDAERIGILGASAGANLASLAALGASAPVFANAYPGDAHASVSAKVKVLAGIYGIYDNVEMWRRYHASSPHDNGVEQFLGVAPMADRNIYFDSSPISYATIANNSVAVLLSWGTEDDLVNARAQSHEFLLALKQAGFFVRTCIVQGAPHYWMSDPIEEATSYSGFLAPRLWRFLAEKL